MWFATRDELVCGQRQRRSQPASLLASLVLTSLFALSLLSCAPPDSHESDVPAETGAEPTGLTEPTGPTDVPRINVEALGRLPAFSHATTVGDLVFVSGTLGTKPSSIELVEGGVGPETAQTMSNIKVILEAAGSSLDQLAKCIVYLTDMDDFAAMNEAWLEAVGNSPPARATIGVNELALGAVVEIECTAAR